MQLLTTPTLGGDKVCRFQHAKMLGDGLTTDLQPLAEFAERLAVAIKKPIEQSAATRVGQSSEYSIIIHLM